MLRRSGSKRGQRAASHAPDETLQLTFEEVTIGADTGAFAPAPQGFDSEESSAVEPETDARQLTPASRRVVTWKRAILAFFVLMIATGGIAYSQKERIAPEVADTSRRLIGDERTAQVESWFFRIEDRLHKTKYRLFGGESNPFETEPVRVQYIARGDAPVVYYFPTTGSRERPPDLTGELPAPVPVVLPEIRQLSSNPAPGEGVWTTAGLPLSSPGDVRMAKTFLRPDPTRPYATVGVLLADYRRAQLHLVAGTIDPGGSRNIAGPGVIPNEHLESLLVAWNGGFKGDHGIFGMQVGSTVFRPLRDNLATICTKSDGSMVMGEYGRDFRWDETFTACRQNAILLVDQGQVSARTNEGNDTWGYVRVDSSEFITWRSAVGVTEDGNILVAAGNSLSADTLAKALWAAGAYYAMQLDINNPYVLTGLYFHQPDGSIESERFMDAMPDTPRRFLRTNERDFMYLTLNKGGYR